MIMIKLELNPYKSYVTISRDIQVLELHILFFLEVATAATVEEKKTLCFYVLSVGVRKSKS